MAHVTFEDNKEVQKHVVTSDKRMLYIINLIDGYHVIDPFMCRHETTHSTFDEAVAVASAFVDW